MQDGVGGATSGCRTTIHFAHPTTRPLALALLRAAPCPNHHTPRHTTTPPLPSAARLTSFTASTLAPPFSISASATAT